MTTDYDVNDVNDKTLTPRLMKGKKYIFFGTLNIQTLQKVGKVHELIASAEATNQDIICVQEHRSTHDTQTTMVHSYGNWRLITCSAWKNSVNATIGGIGMLFSPEAFKALASVDMITPRIMIATLNGNPQTIV